MMRVKYRRKDVNVMMSTEEGSDKALVARLQYPTALRIRFIKTTRVAPMDSPRFMSLSSVLHSQYVFINLACGPVLCQS
jgi:hypothetical protein